MPMPMAMAMAGHKVYGSSNISALLQNEALPGPSHLLDSLWAHTPDPPFRGSNSKPVVDFENVNGSTMRDRPFLQGLDKEENGEEEYEACFHQPGKKRRLTSEQVQFLERNFEVENKLEPERKVQLAKELGLQPRQVAIWFQNRRARFKTKQLEKDYAALKACYDKLKGDYDTLLHQNEKLKQEMNSLKNKLMGIEKDKSHDAVRASEDGSSSKVVNCCKQEDANSAKSDVFDSDSPPQHTADSSSHAVEAEQCSDFSQDEEDDLSHNLLTLPCLPKVEDDDAAAAAVCNFGFPDEDQTFSFWPY